MKFLKKRLWGFPVNFMNFWNIFLLSTSGQLLHRKKLLLEMSVVNSFMTDFLIILKPVYWFALQISFYVLVTSVMKELTMIKLNAEAATGGVL